MAPRQVERGGSGAEWQRQGLLREERGPAQRCCRRIAAGFGGQPDVSFSFRFVKKINKIKLKKNGAFEHTCPFAQPTDL